VLICGIETSLYSHLVIITLGEGLLTCKRERGQARRKFGKETLRYQGPVLWACLECFFQSQEVPIPEQHIMIYIWLSPLKVSQKAPAEHP